MNQQENGVGIVHRGPAFALLGLAITLALLTMLLVGLSTSLAAPSRAPAKSEKGCCPFDDGAATTDEHAAIVDLTIIVATSPDFWPMEYISGTLLVGHDIDLMDALAAQMDVTVVYTEVAFGDIITGLVEARYDAIISGLTISPDREELVDFTLPYVVLGGSEDIAVAIQQGDDTLQSMMNAALLRLKADGVLQTIIAAIEDDVPDWQPTMPLWPRVNLPVVVGGSGE